MNLAANTEKMNEVMNQKIKIKPKKYPDPDTPQTWHQRYQYALTSRGVR